MTGIYKEIKNRFWVAQCPVLLENVGLFIDSNNEVVAFCLFRNLSVQNIQSVSLHITCLSADGTHLIDGLDYVYADLTVPSNQLFGDKNAYPYS